MINNKNNKIDPKELKILSDILALVLEDQSGQSFSALETIKKRAKNNAVTGGALKNLFSSIANNPPQKSNDQNTQKTRTTSNHSIDLNRARARISELTQTINRIDSTVRNLKAQNESLRSELLLTQKSRSELQAQLLKTNSKPFFKTMLITISFLCGLLFGIAGTFALHSISTPTPPVDNTIYLH